MQIVTSTPISGTGSDFLTSLIVDPYLPKGNQLKVKKLLRRLGRHFDPEFMSVDKPGNSEEQDKLTFSMDSHDIKAWLYKHNIGNSVDKQIFEMLVKTLQQTSSCKIQNDWEDLGKLFFPRYIKTGTCISRGSCSWPSGMRCQPSDVKVLRVLRWRCKRKRRVSIKSKNPNRTKDGKIMKTKIKLSSQKFGKLKCNWKLIPYEVTIGCSCQC